MSAPKLTFVEHPSENYNERTLKVDTILLHYTAGELTPSLRHLCDTSLGANRVSSHYVVARDGTIYRLVDESKRAWHAGASQWRGRADVNSSSVGVEIVNLGLRSDGTLDPYREKQIASVIRLCKDIKRRHRILYVLGHSDVAVGRKQDPGEHFPWKRLADEGLGLWTEDLLLPKISKRAMLEAIGYDVTDVSKAFTAFERHFYPEALTRTGTSETNRLTAVFKAVTTVRTR